MAANNAAGLFPPSLTQKTVRDWEHAKRKRELKEANAEPPKKSRRLANGVGVEHTTLPSMAAHNNCALPLTALIIIEHVLTQLASMGFAMRPSEYLD